MRVFPGEHIDMHIDTRVLAKGAQKINGVIERILRMAGQANALGL